jgi:hypothetical protein
MTGIGMQQTGHKTKMQKSLDTSKLLGFDKSGQPIFDIVETAVEESLASRAAGTGKAIGFGKAGGVGKVPGDVKT